jgi:short-subunit dehydrogenase involved in D-alanine esterification of teichoic acids
MGDRLMKLRENTILITGGASGIGLALAKVLHSHGNTVIVCGRCEERLAELKSKLPEVVTYRCDLADEASLDRFACLIMENHPGLNVLVNNAGVQYKYPFTEDSSHSNVIREEVAINCVAPMLLTDRLLPALLQQTTAAIINVTSALALAPKKSAPVYCATKSAMHSFTQSLRYQLDGSAVKVFELVPALVDTEMTRGRGKGKISPEALASETLKAIAIDDHNILIGKTKILYLLYRFLPSIARRLLKDS